jgi:hypothetical protein
LGNLSLGSGFLEIFALIANVLADANAEKDFEAAPFPVHLQCDEGSSLDRNEAEEFPDFALVKQEPTHRLWFVIKDVGLFVRLDVELIEPRFILFDASEGFSEVPLPGAERFDLGTAQDQSGLVGFEDLVVAVGLAVGDQILAHYPSNKAATGGIVESALLSFGRTNSADAAAATES